MHAPLHCQSLSPRAQNSRPQYRIKVPYPQPPQWDWGLLTYFLPARRRKKRHLNLVLEYLQVSISSHCTTPLMHPTHPQPQQTKEEKNVYKVSSSKTLPPTAVSDKIKSTPTAQYRYRVHFKVFQTTIDHHRHNVPVVYEHSCGYSTVKYEWQLCPPTIPKPKPNPN